jgi:hypothetical protein
MVMIGEADAAPRQLLGKLTQVAAKIAPIGGAEARTAR